MPSTCRTTSTAATATASSTSRRTRAALAAATALGVVAVGVPTTATAAPVPGIAPDTATTVVSPAAPTPAGGRFGSQDPSFDGVYRQSLAILALDAAGSRVPADATRWLVRQQCDDGSFQAYRADLAVPCSEPDPAAFTGKDSNSTALAAMALRSVGRSREAGRAIAWLRKDQNPDGGWDYVEGAGSDANSTGLVMAAFRDAGTDPATVKRKGRSGAQFLATVRLGCTAPTAQRGGLAFQVMPGSTPIANDLSSAQGLLGLVGELPVSPRLLSNEAPRLRCSGGDQSGSLSLSKAVAGYLSRALSASGGALPDAYGSGGTDWTATAMSAIALVASGTGRVPVSQAVVQLGRNVADYTRDDDGAGRPAALASLILVAVATGQDPDDFGRRGSDLVGALLKTKQG